ncbi:MAG: efflux RND transporter periplasmic adaptor subunit [Pseudomonadota bacterium]
MARHTPQILVSIALLAVASGAALALFLLRPPSAIKPPEYKPVEVEAAEVALETVRIPVQAQGTVTALRHTALLSEVQGRVIEVSENFLVGGFVEEGEVLLRIDPRDYEAALLRAQAALESAESNLAQERGRAEVALQEWQKLPKNSQRSVEATDLYLRKPQLELVEAQALSAEADLENARDDLDRTIIRAPYAALIRGKSVDLGQYVSPGTSLTDILSVETAEVRLPLPQSRLDYVELPRLADASSGAPIDLYTDVSGQVRHWPATLHRTEGVYDERSRVLFLVARVSDPYALTDSTRPPLRIGTFVNANIQGRAIDNLVTLPRYVLRSGNQVWVIDDNKQLRNRTVETLNAGDEMVYVTRGLQPGELVSLTALDNSFGGATVNIIEQVPTTSLGKASDPIQALEASAATTEPADDAPELEPGTS